MAASSKRKPKPRPKALDPYEVGPLGLFRLVDEEGREVAASPFVLRKLGAAGLRRRQKRTWPDLG